MTFAPLKSIRPQLPSRPQIISNSSPHSYLRVMRLRTLSFRGGQSNFAKKHGSPLSLSGHSKQSEDGIHLALEDLSMFDCSATVSNPLDLKRPTLIDNAFKSRRMELLYEKYRL
jgi:hypothetical protein